MLSFFLLLQKHIVPNMASLGAFLKMENRGSKQTVTNILHVQRSKLSWPFSKSLESALALLPPQGLCFLSKAFLCCAAVPWVEAGSSYPPPATACSPAAADNTDFLRSLWLSLRLAPHFQRFVPVKAVLGPADVLLLPPKEAMPSLSPFVRCREQVTRSAVSF